MTSFTTPELPSGLEVIAVATGLLSEHPREANAFSLLAIAPDGSAGFIAQDPTVQVLHASPDAPAVDLAAGDVTIVSNLAFGEISGALQLPPGSYDLDILPAGSSDVVTTITTPTLEAGQRYLATATGFLVAGEGEEAFSVEYLVDGLVAAEEMAAVQLVHYSPDVPAVDIGVVDGDTFTVLFGDVAYTDATDPMGVMLPAATTEVGLAIAGTGTPAVSFDVTVDAGLTAFGLVTGSLGAGEGREALRVIVVDTTAGLPWVTAEIFPN